MVVVLKYVKGALRRDVQRLVWLARISFAHAFVGHFVVGSDCKAFVFDTLSCVQYLHG